MKSSCNLEEECKLNSRISNSNKKQNGEEENTILTRNFEQFDDFTNNLQSNNTFNLTSTSIIKERKILINDKKQIDAINKNVYNLFSLHQMQVALEKNEISLINEIVLNNILEKFSEETDFTKILLIKTKYNMLEDYVI